MTEPEAALEINADETLVPAYALPDPLCLTAGEAVQDTGTWWMRRRLEILTFRESRLWPNTRRQGERSGVGDCR